MPKKTVKFVGPSAPYFTGDVAGFEETLADAYIAKGVAKPWNPETGSYIDTPAEPVTPVIAVETVPIPESWQDLKAIDMVALARSLGASDDVSTKAAAQAFIEIELAKRSGTAA